MLNFLVSFQRWKTMTKDKKLPYKTFVHHLQVDWLSKSHFVVFLYYSTEDGNMFHFPHM